MEGNLTLDQSTKAYSLIRASDELESVADYCYSISRYRHRLYRNELTFSESAWNEVFEYFQEIRGFFDKAVGYVSKPKPELFSELTETAITLNKHADDIRSNHLDRMRDGTCQPLPAITFSDITVAMRRVKNHTVNLFEAIKGCSRDIEDIQEQKIV
jgi:phosphate:Na+ symporter